MLNCENGERRRTRSIRPKKNKKIFQQVMVWYRSLLRTSRSELPELSGSNLAGNWYRSSQIIRYIGAVKTEQTGLLEQARSNQVQSHLQIGSGVLLLTHTKYYCSGARRGRDIKRCPLPIDQLIAVCRILCTGTVPNQVPVYPRPSLFQSPCLKAAIKGSIVNKGNIFALPRRPCPPLCNSACLQPPISMDWRNRWLEPRNGLPMSVVLLTSPLLPQMFKFGYNCSLGLAKGSHDHESGQRRILRGKGVRGNIPWPLGISASQFATID